MPTVSEVEDTATHCHSILHLCYTWCSVWSYPFGYCGTVTTFKWFHILADMCGPFHTLAGSNSHCRHHGWDRCKRICHWLGCEIWSSLCHHNWSRRTVPIPPLAAVSTVARNQTDSDNRLPPHSKWFGRTFPSPIKGSSKVSVYPRKMDKFTTNGVIRCTHGTQEWSSLQCCWIGIWHYPAPSCQILPQQQKQRHRSSSPWSLVIDELGGDAAQLTPK